MNWKTKATIQKTIAFLPDTLANHVYYLLQRNFGNCKNFEPWDKIEMATKILNTIDKKGYETKNKLFFEVGTGSAPVMPICFWLAGNRTITVDQNRYLKQSLIKNTIITMKKDTDRVVNLFGDLLDIERFNKLLSVADQNINILDILTMCEIEYLAPYNAAKTELVDKQIDFHISNAVYEHIPIDILQDIIIEGNRITKNDALFINNIDYRDHFAHGSDDISIINFLQYNEIKWNKLAGNKYSYCNRARHDDYIKIFEKANHIFVDIIASTSNELLELIKKGNFQFDEKFIYKDPIVLATISAFFVTKKSF